MIKFRKLLYKDIEQVMKWRNNSKIRQQFLDNRVIEYEEQERWFNSLNLDKDYYFILEVYDKPIGLFYLNNFNSLDESAEPNGFVGDVSFLNAPEIGKALLGFFDFAFNKLNVEILKGKILKSNISFINIHKTIGAEILEGKDKSLCYTTLSKKKFNLFLYKTKLKLKEIIITY